MSLLCLLMPLDSALYYFISSVVSIFKVDTLKLREGKRVLLVTQLLGGRVRTELRYPQLLVQDFLSVTALPPRPVGPLVLIRHTCLSPSLVFYTGHSGNPPLLENLLSFPLPLLPALSPIRELQRLADSAAHLSPSAWPHTCHGRQ